MVARRGDVKRGAEGTSGRRTERDGVLSGFGGVGGGVDEVEETRRVLCEPNG